jgi:single-strand DNA-binding protein
MASLNSCNFIGRLGKDPESKEVGETTVCKFYIAVSEKFKGRDGNMQERTEWVNCIVWGKLAEICAKFLHKGSLAYVSGALQVSSWEKDGVKQYKTEINVKEMQMLDGKKGDGAEHTQEADGDSLPF